MQKFGTQLRLLRRKNGMTQEELSFRAGISTSQVARIEAGTLNTTISTIVCISRAMEIDPGLFFEMFRTADDTRLAPGNEQVGNINFHS